MNTMAIADRLKKLRESKGMTQEQVAKKAKLNLDDYKAMEKGEKLDDKERLRKACDALGIKIEDLFDPQTFINYGENSGTGSIIGVGIYNSQVFQRNEEDIALLNSISEGLKNVTSHLQIIIDSILVLSQGLDDTVLKKRMEDLFRNFPKDKDDDKE